jgi:ATP-dependent RNA circularization protein (DNA/RNA ligase family)
MGVGDILHSTSSEINLTGDIYVSEKIDGSNVRIHWDGENFILGNRKHILKKGYIDSDKTSRLQYRPLWNWVHQNIKMLDKINDIFGYPVSLYGEWCHVKHGTSYSLPDKLAFFDIWDTYKMQWVSCDKFYNVMSETKLTTVPFIGKYNSLTISDIQNIISNTNPKWDDGDPIEGIYIKVCENGEVTNRYKYVNELHTNNKYWDNNNIIKQ